ncbi:MAG TPA: magnesium transporter [Actinomycetes bacterium]|nr:magnesium transporter [Actinomycetes bacterium]
MTGDPRTQPPPILGTAAEHVSTAVPVVSADATAEGALAAMRGQRFDSAAIVAVCRDGALVGIVSIERLLAATPDTVIGELMDTHPPTVGAGTDQELAAWQAVRHGQAGLAVVGADGRFRGIIPPQRLLAVLLAEHDEDIARLGGFLGSTASARTASLEPVTRRLWHRLPWLLVGLVGAMLAAILVGSFETELNENVLIAFFVPGIVYLADAVGTQTEALVIRGLSVGIGIRRVAGREIVTGLLVGAVLAAGMLPLTWLVWGDAEVAVAVSAALLTASSIATVVAMALPWAFHRLGKDPAFGSGPLATVIQDLLSIAIYLVIAKQIVG